MRNKILKGAYDKQQANTAPEQPVVPAAQSTPSGDLSGIAPIATASTSGGSTTPTPGKNRRGLIILLTLVMVACAVGIIVLVLSLSQPGNPSSTGEAAVKGGQVNTPASAPAITGPVAPTPAPSLPPTAVPVVTPTQPPATVPATDAISPTPVETATPAPPVGIIPVKFKIPAIGVDTFVERVGVDKNGDMDVPKNIWNVAWFGLGYNPGQPGNAVIAGHLDGIGTKAIFWDLDKLKPGDQIMVTGDDNRQLTFEVINSQSYPYSNAPLQTIFGPSTEAHLNLITCSGIFDNHSLMYNQRLIVYTRLVSTSPTPGATPTVK